MFSVIEDQTALIQAAFDRGGELSVAVELRRLFPGIADMRMPAAVRALSSAGVRVIRPVRREQLRLIQSWGQITDALADCDAHLDG